MGKAGFVVVLNGMTGVGKSKIARSIASQVDGEIICADSVQLHKGLDIITNKPKQDQDSVHLMGRFDSFKPLDANSFTIEARKTINDIHQRGKIPIIEGGSFFYIKHLFQGLAESFEPNAYEEAKRVVRQIMEADQNDFQKLCSRLDDLSAPLNMDSQVEKNDFFRLEQKLTRALYLRKQNITWDQFVQTQRQRPENIHFANMKRFNFFLQAPRLELNKRIDHRVEEMVLDDRFFEEVLEFANLVTQASGDCSLNPLFRSIGFLETIEYLQKISGINTKLKKDRTRLNQATTLYLEKFKSRTRKYSHYQHKTGRSQIDFLKLGPNDHCDIINLIQDEEKYHERLKHDIKEVLSQADIKKLNTYKSKGNLLEDKRMLDRFTKKAIEVVNKNNDLIFNSKLRGHF